MKLKDFKITLMPDKEIGEHLSELFDEVKSGKKVKYTHRIIVRSAEEITKIITPERIRLLQTVREKKPKSITELAEMLDRKRSNVISDLRYLSGFRLIDFQEDREGRVKKKPVVNYDNVSVTIPVKIGALQ